MLPQHLIVEFWDTVRQELKRCGVAEESIARAIAIYRAALDRHDAGEAVYHRNPEDVAQTIAAGWEYGFPDPKPPAKKRSRTFKRSKV